MKTKTLNGKLIFGMILIGMIICSGTVFADHTASVTIDPDIANCNELGNTFTVTIENDANSSDSIWTVDIYKSVDVTNFSCGPAPVGWYLADYSNVGLCRYTASDSSNYIANGSQLNFTFDAVMISSCQCLRSFHVATLDNQTPTGQYQHNYPSVNVDCKQPKIHKSITSGNYQGVCPPEKQDSGDICWMTNGTIHVTAYDNDTCDLGIDYCKWSYTVDGTLEDSGIKQNGNVLEWDIVFDEDSVHVLNITCVDNAGNKIEDIETFKVDSTPPETNKTVSEPKKIENGVEWVDTVTEITFTSNDPDPTGHDCNIGVDKTWYKNILACGEDPCWNPAECTADGVDSPYDEEVYDGCIDECQESCSENYTPNTNPWYDCVEGCSYDVCKVDEGWKLYRGVPINKDQESCHILYYFSVDKLGNIEPMQVNCFFVDKTPPIMIKEVGEPSYYENSETKEDNLCYKSESTGWRCDYVNYPQSGKVTYESYGPFLKINVKLYGLTPNHGYQLTLNGRCGGDGNIFDTMCPAPNTPATWLGYEAAWECGNWSKDCNGTICQETFWNFDMNAVTDADGNYEKTYFLRLPDGHYGSAGSGCTPGPCCEWPIAFIVKDFADVPGGSNYKPVLMEESGLEWTIDKNQSVWVKDHETPITLDCMDLEPHPSGDEEVCYRVSFDGDPADLTSKYCDEDLEEITQARYEGQWCCVPAPKTIIFKEDSLHDLEWFCRDAVDKKSEIDLEWFKVDSQPPIINKTMSGPQVGNCPPEDENDKCWIKDWTCESNGTTIHIDAYDNDSLGCAVDQITCDWWYILDDSQIINETYMQGLTPPFNITFYDETEHELHVKCCDALGNCYEDVETFYVDSSGPNVTKEFIGPWYRNQSGVEWIDTITNVSLTAHDNPCGECAVDNSTIYWKDNYFPNSGDWHYCYQACAGWNPQYPSNPLDPTGEGWNKYEEPFNDLNESCHVLEYYAVDALGNVGPIGVNCFFSDHTKPVAKLRVGDPHINCTQGEDCDYWVRDHKTKIYLNCENRGPHPSPLDKIQWRIWDDITGNWTEWNESQAGVCGYDVTIVFNEDSVHKIQYKCNDTVGKETDVKEKVFRVDSTPPIINKTMLGIEGKDWNGSCPPKNPRDICYVRGGSGILVSVYDPDPTGKGCAVDNVSCSYEVWWNNTLVDNGTFTNSTEIKFNEDSAHDVVIYCEDALGNSIEDNETFLVDKKPPVTTKTYGEPKLSNCTHRWITSSTPINLTATDEKIGVKYIEYRVTYIGNETCPEICNYNGTGNWTKVSGDFAQFTISEDSCHLIEFHAVDKFGNSETIHKQCVMVDNTPPTPNKTVGKPKTKWDGKDAVYYDIADKCWSDDPEKFIECWKVTLCTPITLDCIDPEPHPVDHEETCFRVGVDGDDKTEYYCNLMGGLC